MANGDGEIVQKVVIEVEDQDLNKAVYL